MAAGFVAIPTAREALLGRGTSHRFEVWTKFMSLISERPLIGYGSFSPMGITTDNGVFLDQSHNLVLSAWFRGGIVSALGYGFYPVRWNSWARRYSLWSGDVVPLCVIATIATAGMFGYELFVTYPTWPWVTFWLPFDCASAQKWRHASQAKIADVSTKPSDAPDVRRLRPC